MPAAVIFLRRFCGQFGVAEIDLSLGRGNHAAASTAVSSLWPLPSTPATPTISPRSTVSVKLSRRVTALVIPDGQPVDLQRFEFWLRRLFLPNLMADVPDRLEPEN